MNVPFDILDAILRLQRPLIIGHVRPDADCLGSILGLATALQPSCPNVRAAIPEGTVSRRLAFLPRWADIPAATDADFAAADGFIVVDTAKESRCSVNKALPETWRGNRPLINIDHHESNTRFGDVNWVVPTASSTAELIHHVIGAGGWPPTTETASLLYAGLHSDTVGFSLPTTTAAVLEVAAELVRRGADVGTIGLKLSRSHDRREFELLRLIYDNTRVTPDGAIAYSSASYEEMTRLGCTAADVDDQVAVPRSIEGIRMAILVTEGKPGKARVNLRGEDGTSVLPVALKLGGGGHEQSAGAVVDAPLHEAIKRVLELAATVDSA